MRHSRNRLRPEGCAPSYPLQRHPEHSDLGALTRGTISMSTQDAIQLPDAEPRDRGAHLSPPMAGSSRGVLVVLAATVGMAMGFGGLGLITVFMGPIEADLQWSRSDMS